MKFLHVLLTIGLSLCVVLPTSAFETCQKNYLGNPFLTSKCKNYCCGTTDYQYCCSLCTSSLYSSSSCGLSGQSIAGIVIGSIAFVIILAILVLVILYVRKKKEIQTHASPTDNEHDLPAYENRSKDVSIFNAEAASSSSELTVMPPPPPSYNYGQPDDSNSKAKTNETQFE